MHSQIVSLSLMALLSTIPHTSAAPTKRQFPQGGRFGPGGFGGPGGFAGPESRPQGWRPPWVSPSGDSSPWNSAPEPSSAIPDPASAALTPSEDITDPTVLSTNNVNAGADASAATSIAASPVVTSATVADSTVSTTVVVSSSVDGTPQPISGTTYTETVANGLTASLSFGATSSYVATTQQSLTTTLASIIDGSSSTLSTSAAGISESSTITTTNSLAGSASQSVLSSTSSSSATMTIATSFTAFLNTTSSAATSIASESTSTVAITTSASVAATSTAPGSSTSNIISTSASSASTIAASTTTASPGTPGNMLNGTFPSNSPPASPPQATPGLNVDLKNTFSSSGPISVYITALDESGRVMFLTPSQTWFYPTADSNSIPKPVDASTITIPLGAAGSTTTLNLPGYFSSGRIYFSRSGSLAFFTLLNQHNGVSIVSPNPLNPTDASYNTDWAFIEMTYTSASGLFANLSFVDFLARLPLGMQLTIASGAVQTVQGTTSSSLDDLCSKLSTQAAADGQPWNKLCQNSGESSSPTILRANSPAKYIAAVESSAFASYWDSYIDSVWQQYATEDLLVDTQRLDLGVVPCSTASGNLVCTGASRPFPKPVSTSTLFTSSPALDIFSCAGIFSSLETDNAITLALLPRLCAAINRSTLLLAGGNTTPSDTVPPSSYYPGGVSATNFYAKFVHEVERDGRGYAFAYDDVAPTGEGDVSGTVAGEDVSAVQGGWTVWVGGMPSS